VASDNTALVHRRKLLGHGDAVSTEARSRDNPARLSLRPVPHPLHLSLSGSLMLERYMKGKQIVKEKVISNECRFKKNSIRSKGKVFKPI